jgi:multisubunit Na+/H+ antiporter MnhB subunit
MRSRILDVGVRTIFHTLLLLSLFMLLRGHNQPGGGFAGGLIAGAAFVLAWLARGPSSLSTLRLAPETLLGLGLLVAIVTALAPLAFGGELLESGYRIYDLPRIGEVKVFSVLAFDIGVYLVVVGFVALALARLGGDDVEEASR